MSLFTIYSDENAPNIPLQNTLDPKSRARPEHKKTLKASLGALGPLNPNAKPYQPSTPIKPQKVVLFPVVGKENAPVRAARVETAKENKPPVEKKLCPGEMVQKKPFVAVNKIEENPHENAIDDKENTPAPEATVETAKENQPPVEKKLTFADMVKANLNIALKKVEVITHQNAIFGSYCLEDVRCISSMVFKAMSNPQPMKFDCFNYETVEHICKREDLKEIFDRNIQFLNDQTEKGLIDYTLHYQDMNNDLLQRRGDITAATNWYKFDRAYQQNMIFFNPYLETGAKTAQLIQVFFGYAKNSLEKEGVVTIMWNTKRGDRGFEGINIREIGRKQGFICVKTLSGSQFALLFGFVHTKNSTSLEVSEDATVSVKQSDHIMMFMRSKQGETPTIPLDNKIAMAFVQTLNAV